MVKVSKIPIKMHIVHCDKSNYEVVIGHFREIIDLRLLEDYKVRWMTDDDPERIIMQNV
jgi:RIO-like serine/threonine protein kinase